MVENESVGRRCPVCGGPVAMVPVIGPTEAIVGPCGHRVAPQLLD